MSNNYTIYAVPQGSLYKPTDPNAGFAPVWGYNAALDQWEIVSPQPDIAPGYVEMNHQVPYADIAMMPEGPIQMGPYQLVPGWMEGEETDTSPFIWMMLNWAHNPASQEVVSVALSVTEDSVTYYPNLFCAEPDPTNPGAYYVGGSQSQIGHWDGTSSSWVNMGNPGDYVASLDWSHFVVTGLTTPTGPGNMAREVSPPSNTPITGIKAGYIFRQAGYFWIMPIVPSVYHQSTAGGLVEVTTNVVYRTQDAGAGLMDNTVIGNGSLRANFLQYRPFIDSPAYGTGQENLPPVYWDDLVFISVRRSCRGGAPAYPLLYNNAFVRIVDPTGNIHEVLSPSFDAGAGEIDAVGLGCYKHPITGDLYAFYASGDVYFVGNHASSGVNGATTLHILKLNSVDRTTWTCSWTEIGTRTVSGMKLDPVFSVSSDTGNLFIHWRTADSSAGFYGGVMRFDLSGHTFHDWQLASSSYWFIPPMFIRPAAAAAARRRSYVIQI